MVAVCSLTSQPGFMSRNAEQECTDRNTCSCYVNPCRCIAAGRLSARAFHQVLKLARTIANLADAEVIAAPHLADALQYRPRSEAT
jgi:predicted ATPase with chaperone activity